MHVALLLIANCAVGIDAGWQPVDAGGFVYILQFRPHELNSLLDGTDRHSDVPPQLNGIRRLVIRVGQQEPPRIDAGMVPPSSPDTALAPLSTPKLEVGWQPIDVNGVKSGFEYQVRLTPEAVASLRRGEAVGTEIDARFRGLRGFRITAGRGPLSRLGDPLAPPAVAEQPRTPLIEEATPRPNPLASRPPNFGPPRGAASNNPPFDRYPNRIVGPPRVSSPPAETKPAETASTPPSVSQPPEGNIPIPGAFDADPNSVSIAGHSEVAGHSEIAGHSETASPPTDASPGDQQISQETARPELPADVPNSPLRSAMMAVLLFVSLGGNAYLAWLAWGFRSRCRGMIQNGWDLRHPGDHDEDVPHSDDEDQDVRAIDESELRTEV